MSCTIYVACKMSNRDRKEMIYRAVFVTQVLMNHGLDPISPVIAEEVVNQPGILVNDDEARLKAFWTADKELIRRRAHVVLMDHAEMKSYGMENEYALARFCLWKPTVLVMEKHNLSIADFEADFVTDSISAAAEFIRINFNTWPKRAWWRVKMLTKTLPGWLLYQALAFR